MIQVEVDKHGPKKGTAEEFKQLVEQAGGEVVDLRSKREEREA